MAPNRPPTGETARVTAAATPDAIVVGSGPNGLAAAARLARAGVRVLVLEAADQVGGGLRSTRIGPVIIDHCASVHPLGVVGRAWRELGLAPSSPSVAVGGADRGPGAGVAWATPPIDLAHVLDGGRAALLGSDAEHRDLVVDSLGADAARWRRRVGRWSRHYDALAEAVLSPVVPWPRHPALLAAFGASAVASATRSGTRFDDEPAAALFAGLAAHSAVPLEAPLTAGPGMLLGAAADAVRWPVARGGSQTIADALVAIVEAAGGSVQTGVRVRALDELPPARAVLFDTSPRLLTDICGDRLASRARAAYLAFRHGPGAFKVDYLLHQPIPWTASGARLAGTVHVGGTLFEVAASEQLVARGQLPEQPFLLVGQPTVADPTRAPDGRHLAWVYCHVPQGVDVDSRADAVVAAMEGQLERFAPGFRDAVAERWVTTPGAFEAAAPNQHGGDFAGGSVAGRQLLLRPTPALHPYRTPLPGVYLCSASTPPGPGAHGMCGWHAAGAVLRRELREV